MIVYVVESRLWDSTEILGVYSTRKRAENFVASTRSDRAIEIKKRTIDRRYDYEPEDER